MPLRIKRLSELYILGVVILFLVAVWFFGGRKNPSTQPTKPSTIKASSTSIKFNKALYSTNKANSLWAIVNKGRVLPSDYVPSGLAVPNIPLRTVSSSEEMQVRLETAQALETMFLEATTQNIHLMLASGYRSYGLQASVYSSYVKNDGQAAADASGARPGHSEHQTGLAADLEPTTRVCEVEQCFEKTPEGQWLAQNSYKFGFIIRYPKGKESLTGYEYEPWHVRYVGQQLAAQLHQTDQTLEQFFNLPTYSDYQVKQFQLE